MATRIPSISPEKPIVFISSALINLDDHSSSLDYFVQLLALICQKTHEIVKSDLVVKVPISNKSNEQIEFINQVYENIDNYFSLIISPINAEEVLRCLESNIDSIEKYRKLPVFTIDKHLPSTVNNIGIPYVTSDWENGGEKAAECLLEYINTDSIKDKEVSVLILKGLEGSEPRIQGFLSYLSKSKEGNRISWKLLNDDKRLDFTREKTYKYLSEHFKTNSFIYDIVFACNDEMALGVRDYLVEHNDEKVRSTKVIGFDGTKEFILQLNHELNINLLATVDVQLQLQVNRLFDLIFKINDNRPGFNPIDRNNSIKVECKKVQKNI